MHNLARTLLLGSPAFILLATLSSPVLYAQQEDGPPNVLVIQREYLKPGKGGMLHDRSESAFVRAFADAKSDSHYFALDSLSGPSRSLFLISYNSFADWEKDNAAMRANKTLGAAIDHAQLMDGDLLAGYDSTTFMLRPDLSLNKGHIEGTRYFEITSFVVKPGHVHEFEELGHMYIDGYRKADPDAHWDCFQVVYGTPIAGVPTGSTFVVMNLMKSLVETDKGNETSKKFAAALGATGLKKLGELTASSVETTATSLFAINPRISYPPKEWVDKEPGFWKVTPSSMTKKPAARASNP